MKCFKRHNDVNMFALYRDYHGHGLRNWLKENMTAGKENKVISGILRSDVRGLNYVSETGEVSQFQSYLGGENTGFIWWTAPQRWEGEKWTWRLFNSFNKYLFNNYYMPPNVLESSNKIVNQEGKVPVRIQLRSWWRLAWGEADNKCTNRSVK